MLSLGDNPGCFYKCCNSNRKSKIVHRKLKCLTIFAGENCLMIQRIQSVYLLAAIVIQCLIFNLPAWVGSTNADAYPSKKVSVHSNYTGISTQESLSSKENIEDKTAQMNSGIVIVNSLIILLAIINIFLFRNRKLQFLMCRVLMLLTCILVVPMFYIIQEANELFGTVSHSSVYMPASYLPFVSLILFFLAGRGINADEKLVRSADRLR